MSTEARVPGVSEGAIALNAAAPCSMSCSVAKCWSTTAVPRPSSKSIFSPVEGTPGGGSSDSSIRARRLSSRSRLTSVNRTTRTYIGSPPSSASISLPSPRTRSPLLQHEQLAHRVLSERATAVLPLGEELAGVWQLAVRQAVGVVDDREEHLCGVEEMPVHGAAEVGVA